MRAMTAALLLALATTATAEPTPAQKQALDFIKANMGPLIHDGVWTSDRNLKLGVLAGDSDEWDGVALGICALLRDRGAAPPMTVVHMVDIVKLLARGSWVELGRANCSR